MPPISKITKEMIIDSGKEIIRAEGIEHLNVRKIALKLDCSTQPIMYHYTTVDKLKSEIYTAVDEYHSEYLMNIDYEKINPMLEIGLRYVLFAVEEKNLFRFLFQSDKFSNIDFIQLLEEYDVGLSAIYEILQKETGMSKEQCKEIFANLFITAHGMASLLANNAMKYDEEYCINILENAFYSVTEKIKRRN